MGKSKQMSEESLGTSLHYFKQIVGIGLGIGMGMLKLQGIFVILGCALTMVLLTQVFVSVVLGQEEGTYEWKDIQKEAGMLAFMCFLFSWIMVFTFV